MLVRFGGSLDHASAGGARLIEQFGRDLAVLEARALGRVVPADFLHLDEVDDTGEALFGTDRQLDGHRVALEARGDLLDAAQEVRAGAVQLVDEGEPWHAVLVHLPPDRLRLRLDAGHGAVDGNRGIEHAQRAFDFDREVDVTRRVDDVDAMFLEGAIHALPEAGGGGRGDRDPALLLLLHVVHLGRTVVDLADLVRHARVEQDALGGRGLPRIDVRGNPDVPIALDWGRACHSDRSVRTRRGTRRLPWRQPIFPAAKKNSRRNLPPLKLPR